MTVSHHQYQYPGIGGLQIMRVCMGQAIGHLPNTGTEQGTETKMYKMGASHAMSKIFHFLARLLTVLHCGNHPSACTLVLDRPHAIDVTHCA